MTEEESRGTGKRKNREGETEISEVKKGKRRQVEKDNGEAEWRAEVMKRFDKVDGVLAELGAQLKALEQKMSESGKKAEEPEESEVSDEEEEKETEDKMQE